jgi:hypothetical protein
MNIGYPRTWNPARTLLLVTWLLAGASYAALFFGATYIGQSIAPQRLLLGLLATQACLLAAALLTHWPGAPSLPQLAAQNPRGLFYFSLAAQAALLVAAALAMRPWNDELSNIDQASYLAAHGLRQWLADYRTINGWLGPHHPPLLALLYGAFYGLVGPHLLAGRLFNIAFALGAMVAGARLVRRVADAPTAALASLCWLFYPLWLYNGAAAIMEGPFLLVFLLTADAFAAFLQAPTNRRALQAGGWFALALLCRYNIVLLAPGAAILLLLPAHRAVWKRPGPWLLLAPAALLFVPFVALAAKTGLLAAQADRLKGFTVLFTRGGPLYLTEILLPLWPMHAGAHVIPITILGLLALWRGVGKSATLLALGGGYLAAVLFLLPNPRYMLPALPFLAAGAARVLQAIERRGGGAAATWAGIAGAAFTLAVVVVVAASRDGYYPFY